MDTSTRPCFALADEARQAICDGHIVLGMQLIQQAKDLWDPQDAPEDEHGQPELFWPYIWEGSILTLSLLPDTQMDLEPIDPALQRLLDSINEEA